MKVGKLKDGKAVGKNEVTGETVKVWRRHDGELDLKVMQYGL